MTAAPRLSPLRLVVLGLVVFAAPAAAQWTQVPAVPTTELFSLWANADTIAAGADTVLYLSTDAGLTWKRSARPTTTVAPIEGPLVRNGRLYTGTFGKGVFVSDNLGTSWQAFNEGLVGGFLDTQLDVVDLQARDDSLFAATAGAGVYARSLAGAGTWQPYGTELEPNQASNVNSLALGAHRLLVCAGANGMVFFRDPGGADWSVSNLDNVGIHAALTAQLALWNGRGWVVGTNLGIFSSLAGQEPWHRFDAGLGPLNWTAFAAAGRHLFGAFDVPNAAVMEESSDDGVTWGITEVLPNAFVERMALSGSNLYAARGDGLWRRPVSTASVPRVGADGAARFALAGAQPFREQVRLRFELRAAGRARIELFDIAGRAAGGRIDGWWPAGLHEVTLDASHLAPGVLTARLTADGACETLRLVHVR